VDGYTEATADPCSMFVLSMHVTCRAYIHIQYELGEELGEGAFGKAYRAVRRRVRSVPRSVWLQHVIQGSFRLSWQRPGTACTAESYMVATVACARCTTEEGAR